jgi:hypothetical protein
MLNLTYHGLLRIGEMTVNNNSCINVMMVLTDEIVEPVDGKVYLLKCFCTCNMSSLKMYIIPETTQYMFPEYYSRTD